MTPMKAVSILGEVCQSINDDSFSMQEVRDAALAVGHIYRAFDEQESALVFVTQTEAGLKPKHKPTLQSLIADGGYVERENKKLALSAAGAELLRELQGPNSVAEKAATKSEILERINTAALRKLPQLTKTNAGLSGRPRAALCSALSKSNVIRIIGRSKVEPTETGTEIANQLDVVLDLLQFEDDLVQARILHEQAVQRLQAVEQRLGKAESEAQRSARLSVEKYAQELQEEVSSQIAVRAVEHTSEQQLERLSDFLKTQGTSSAGTQRVFTNIREQLSLTQQKLNKLEEQIKINGSSTGKLSEELMKLLRITDEERFAQKYNLGLNSNKLVRLLERFCEGISEGTDLEPIEEVGQECLFDPTLHECTERLTEGQSVLVMTRGWKQGSELLQKAKVTGRRPTK